MHEKTCRGMVSGIKAAVTRALSSTSTVPNRLPPEGTPSPLPLPPMFSPSRLALLDLWDRLLSPRGDFRRGPEIDTGGAGTTPYHSPSPLLLSRDPAYSLGTSWQPRGLKLPCGPPPRGIHY
ncbi:hypothetical protein DL767_006934 [Monosporascus sp. MG133]|nr:hypothetical protein DL767_006934 [Monosporascus sp. MG133]